MAGETLASEAFTPLTVRMACTASYFKYAIASISSIRRVNSGVPIELHCAPGDLAASALRLLDRFDVRIVHGKSSDGRNPAIASRLLKIAAIAAPANGDILYLDSDTVVTADVSDIRETFGTDVGDSIHLSPSSHSWVKTLADCGGIYTMQRDLTTTEFAQHVSRAFDLRLSPDVLSSIRAWNSGVILAHGESRSRLSEVWMSLYLQMLRNTDPATATYADELPLALAVWQVQDVIPTTLLDRRWNFVPTEAWTMSSPDDNDNDSPRIVHLERHKHSAWATILLRGVLAEVGIDFDAL